MTTETENLITQNKELAKYIAELKDDVNLSISNLREKALMASSIWAKWLSYLYHEKELLGKIAETKQKLLLKTRSTNKVADSVLRMKSEEKMLESDENFQKLAKLQKTTQDNIDYIERALNILSNFGFSIKNVTEIVKLNLSH